MTITKKVLLIVFTFSRLTKEILLYFKHNLKTKINMSTLGIIGWVLLALIWTSMYVRNKKVKQNAISADTAFAWALVNVVAAVSGFILFVVDLAVTFA